MGDPILYSEVAERLACGSFLDLWPYVWREAMHSSLSEPFS